jgi:hypothetical protein
MTANKCVLRINYDKDKSVEFQIDKDLSGTLTNFEAISNFIKQRFESNQDREIFNVLETWLQNEVKKRKINEPVFKQINDNYISNYTLNTVSKIIGRDFETFDSQVKELGLGNIGINVMKYKFNVDDKSKTLKDLYISYNEDGSLKNIYVEKNKLYLVKSFINNLYRIKLLKEYKFNKDQLNRINTILNTKTQDGFISLIKDITKKSEKLYTNIYVLFDGDSIQKRKAILKLADEILKSKIYTYKNNSLNIFTELFLMPKNIDNKQASEFLKTYIIRNLPEPENYLIFNDDNEIISENIENKLSNLNNHFSSIFPDKNIQFQVYTKGKQLVLTCRFDYKTFTEYSDVSISEFNSSFVELPSYRGYYRYKLTDKINSEFNDKYVKSKQPLTIYNRIIYYKDEAAVNSSIDRTLNGLVLSDVKNNIEFLLNNNNYKLSDKVYPHIGDIITILTPKDDIELMQPNDYILTNNSSNFNQIKNRLRELYKGKSNFDEIMKSIDNIEQIQLLTHVLDYSKEDLALENGISIINDSLYTDYVVTSLKYGENVQLRKIDITNTDVTKPNKVSQNIILFKKFYNKLCEANPFLNNNNLIILTEDEIDELVKAGKMTLNTKAFLDTKTNIIYINPYKASYEDCVHEILHILLGKSLLTEEYETLLNSVYLDKDMYDSLINRFEYSEEELNIIQSILNKKLTDIRQIKIELANKFDKQNKEIAYLKTIYKGRSNTDIIEEYVVSQLAKRLNNINQLFADDNITDFNLANLLNWKNEIFDKDLGTMDSDSMEKIYKHRWASNKLEELINNNNTIEEQC